MMMDQWSIINGASRPCVRLPPTLLIGCVPTPVLFPTDNRPQLPARPRCSHVRRRTPLIPAASARTTVDALVVEENSIAPLPSTSRPRTSSRESSPQRRVLQHPSAPALSPFCTPSCASICAFMCLSIVSARLGHLCPAPRRRPVLALTHPPVRVFFAVSALLPRSPPPLFIHRPFPVPCSVAPACISSCRLRFVASPMSPRAVHVFFAHSSMA